MRPGRRRPRETALVDGSSCGEPRSERSRCQVQGWCLPPVAVLRRRVPRRELPMAVPDMGGPLTAGFSGGTSADTLDPLNAIDNVETAYSAGMFDSMIEIGRDGLPHLELAEEITPSKDGRTWTIRLRRGISFHDGRELTADDVLYTLRRIASKQHPAVGAPRCSGSSSRS